MRTANASRMFLVLVISLVLCCASARVWAGTCTNGSLAYINVTSSPATLFLDVTPPSPSGSTVVNWTSPSGPMSVTVQAEEVFTISVQAGKTVTCSDSGNNSQGDGFALLDTLTRGASPSLCSTQTSGTVFSETAGMSLNVLGTIASFGANNGTPVATTLSYVDAQGHTTSATFPPSSGTQFNIVLGPNSSINYSCSALNTDQATSGSFISLSLQGAS